MKRCSPLIATLIPGLALLAHESTPSSSAADPTQLLDLLQTPITVASRKPMTLRESPAVVSCLTRDEILASGARDLIDVLRLVPGFEVALDNFGITGLATRGLWAYEGKVLVLWDGIEMSELVTGTTPLGHRFPVDQIKRIEIIRGPGSAQYGGSAELAVIKILTLAAEGQDDLALGLMGGYAHGHTLRKAGQVVYGRTLQSGLRFFGGLYRDQGLRSASPWMDNGGMARDAALNSVMSSDLVQFGVQWKGLDLRGVLDEYSVQDPIYRPTQLQQKYRSASQSLTLSWQVPLGVGMKLTPFALYRRDTPNRRFVEPRPNPLTRTVLRVKGGVRFEWEINPAFNLGLGGEHYQDDASTGADTTFSFYPPGSSGPRTATFRDTALYGELGYRGFLNFLVGARWEEHSAAGSAFVPRFAVTKVFGDWHLKLLHAEAFRTPAALQLRPPTPTTSTVEPERTRTSELEVGFRRDAHFLSLNLFETLLLKPIYDTGVRVLNGTRTGSRGAEMDYKLRRSWGIVNISYAYFWAHDQEVLKWSVAGHDDRFLAMANHKASGLASFFLGRGWSLDPSFTWLGSRYGWNREPGDTRVTLRRFNPDLLLNLQLAWRWRGLTVSMAAFDLLDRNTGYLQAFAGSQVPLPDGGREAVLKLRWSY